MKSGPSRASLLGARGAEQGPRASLFTAGLIGKRGGVSDPLEVLLLSSVPLGIWWGSAKVWTALGHSHLMAGLRRMENDHCLRLTDGTVLILLFLLLCSFFPPMRCMDV